MPALVDFSKYDLNNASFAEDDSGVTIGRILPGKKGDRLIVEPVSGLQGWSSQKWIALTGGW